MRHSPQRLYYQFSPIHALESLPISDLYKNTIFYLYEGLPSFRKTFVEKRMTSFDIIGLILSGFIRFLACHIVAAQ
jgi:uncharacterized membrane protein